MSKIQMKKDKYHIISLMWKLKKPKQQTNKTKTHKYRDQCIDQCYWGIGVWEVSETGEGGQLYGDRQ